MVKIGMMIGDRYEILEKIGTGGMSDVYKAKCHKLNRFVAVKVLKQEFSETPTSCPSSGSRRRRRPDLCIRISSMYMMWAKRVVSTIL